MRNRRRMLVLGVLAACLGLATCAGWWRLSAPPRINWDDFRQLKAGMTQEEVEAILGGPPGDYSAGPPQNKQNITISFADDPILTRKEWRSDTLKIAVGFDDQGRLARSGMAGDIGPRPSIWQRLRVWLGL
jgi:hypothetical protein